MINLRCPDHVTIQELIEIAVRCFCNMHQGFWPGLPSLWGFALPTLRVLSPVFSSALPGFPSDEDLALAFSKFFTEMLPTLELWGMEDEAFEPLLEDVTGRLVWLYARYSEGACTPAIFLQIIQELLDLIYHHIRPGLPIPSVLYPSLEDPAGLAYYNSMHYPAFLTADFKGKKDPLSESLRYVNFCRSLAWPYELSTFDLKLATSTLVGFLGLSCGVDPSRSLEILSPFLEL